MTTRKRNTLSPCTGSNNEMVTFSSPLAVIAVCFERTRECYCQWHAFYTDVKKRSMGFLR